MRSNKFVLLFLFFTVIALVFVSRSFFLGELSVIERIAGKVQEENVKQLSRVIEAQAQINRVPWLVSRFFLTDNPEKKEYIEAQIRQQIMMVEHRYINAFYYQEDEAPLFSYVVKNWRGYTDSVFQTLASDKNHQIEEAQERTENSLLYLERLNDGMRMIVAFHERDVAEKTSGIVEASRLSKENVLLLTVSVTVILSIIGLIAFRKIATTEEQLLSQIYATNQLAYHDSLTGLANRLYFQQILWEELQAADASGAVVFFDLDNFKLVNDSHGHDVGDNLLALIADRIRALSTPQIFEARFGGDEFVLMLKNFTEEEVREYLTRLQTSMAMPANVNGVILNLTSSIGVAFYPLHGSDVVELLKKADIAMYQAKARKNSYAIYDGKALEEAAARRRMEDDLKHAIDRQELSLVYQPIIASHSLQLTGLEALLRWNSPEHGPVPPSVFIPMAEATGMIVPIGQWVFREAAGMIKVLCDMQLPDVFVSVNVSVIQLMQDDFASLLDQTAAEYHIPLDKIKIEITESVLMESFEHVQVNIEGIRNKGLSFCLDDFGTGYSCVNYLTQLPLEVLKLDKSLTDRLEGDPRDRAVFENLIRMAHAIGITVVAEGVENKRQLAVIRQMDCEFAQGYLISRPLPKAEILEKLSQKRLEAFAVIE